ncbi:macro domain-containing protein [Paramagnetospirillum magneticum]|uniref:macro domain-containing protein n=1 Tax=Paramagnetospirillum magneticum TaxID=84159 RepID=UPI00030C9AAE|nr:macro domain-containing protein [Paramagnetospirillum magneticum]
MIDARVCIEVGDILGWEGDAIVNPAHTSLLAGSGLCGIIHRMAGPELEQAAKLLAPCPVGEVRVTPAFALKCRRVIHAVGPRWWDGTRNEIEHQARMYANIAVAAETYGMREVTVPAIGIGIHRFPTEIAAEICCTTLASYVGEVRFRILLPSSELANIYRNKLNSLLIKNC